MKLLIAEDDKDISRALTALFEHNNYAVDTVSNGCDAYDYAAGESYDGIILDIMMPGLDGLEVLKKLRRSGNNTPVLLLTAKAEVEDRIQGLDLGADDYLPKPFHLAELHARIKSVIRRKNRDGNLFAEYGNIRINTDTFEVYVENKHLELNRKEYDILHYFLNRPERLLNKNTLAEAVWGDHIDQTDNFDFIYAQIKNLRKKLIAAEATPEIKAVYGFGYKMTLK